MFVKKSLKNRKPTICVIRYWQSQKKLRKLEGKLPRSTQEK